MKQLDALAIPLNGFQLIEASAGTGKTHAITTLFLRLLLERKLDVEQILVVTFTEAAAAELRERIRRRLRELVEVLRGATTQDADLQRLAATHAPSGKVALARMVDALERFDRCAIATIHGFCRRVLQENAFELGSAFDCELRPDDSPVLEELVQDFWLRKTYAADPELLKGYAARKIDCDSLRTLARMAASHRHLPLEHGTVTRGRTSPPPLEPRWVVLRQLWNTERATIGEIIRSANIDRRSYRSDHIQRWLEKLDNVCNPASESSDGREVLGELERFSARRLRAATKDGRPPEHPFFDLAEAFLDHHEQARTYLDERVLELKLELIDCVRSEFPQRKRLLGIVSFDDLLHDVHDALLRDRRGSVALSIRNRFQAALIDEFQDTDALQYAIFEAVYGATELPVFMIGDPKQAIYGFRGADVYAYLDARKRAEHRVHTMDRNYRSSPRLLGAIEHLFAAPRPFLVENIAFHPVQAARDDSQLQIDGEALPAFEIRFCERDGLELSKSGHINADWAEKHMPRLLAAELRDFLEAGAKIRVGDQERPVRAGDIAVLVRKNAQAQLMQNALRLAGVPAVIYGEASVWQTDEARQLRRVLRAVAEPLDAVAVRTALTTDIFGVRDTELCALLDDDELWSSWVDRFRSWNALWQERGFMRMFRALTDETGVVGRLLHYEGGERAATDLLHLSELLHTAATTAALGPKGLVRWLDQQLETNPIAEETRLRLENDRDAVQIVTIHRSKGLEYPIVYCPYLWTSDGWQSSVDDVLVHDPSDNDRLKIDIGPRSSDHEHALKEQLKHERLAESLRLLYVALTRARLRCVVVWGGFMAAGQSALAYLLHGPAVSSTCDSPCKLIEEHVKSCDDRALLQWLEQRQHPSWHVAPWRTVDAAANAAPRPPAELGAPRLAAREPRPELDRSFRTTSFTQLTTRTASSFTENIDDVDGPHPAAPSLLDLSDIEPQHLITLHAFPRGAKTGNFFHELLENLDFTASDAVLEERVGHHLTTHGFDTSMWTATVAASVRELLSTPLAAEAPDAISSEPCAAVSSALGPDFCLSRLPRNDRIDEMAFTFPVAPEGLAVTRQQLVRVFEQHHDGLPEGYAVRLGQVAFAPLRGYLKGFIDLVFRHGGRYYLVDYKTTYLGDHLEHYRAPQLAEPMAAHHYILQYHLYTLAFVRFLRRRQPGFDYDRDFGGVSYLFLRGVSPRLPGAGVWLDKPPRRRIEALDALFSAADDRHAASGMEDRHA